MESVSGVKCGIAQGGSCGVRTQGTTRVRAWDAPTRGTVTWSRHGTLLLDTVTGHRLRARQEFARGRSRWCGGAGAWHITARHRMDMAL